MCGVAYNKDPDSNNNNNNNNNNHTGDKHVAALSQTSHAPLLLVLRQQCRALKLLFHAAELVNDHTDEQIHGEQAPDDDEGVETVPRTPKVGPAPVDGAGASASRNAHNSDCWRGGARCGSASPSRFPSKPYLVLWGTLCSCDFWNETLSVRQKLAPHIPLSTAPGSPRY